MLADFKDGRFFVSPIIGCPGKCKYCYLPTRSVDQIARRSNYLIESIIESIESNQNFIKGKYGSIISVGAWGDIFSKKSNEDFSINWIKNLLQTGNPVQIMSKFSISDEKARRICDSIQYDNQLLYSTTITTFSNWKVFENGTVSPIERLQTANKFKQYGVLTNVMIKPYLSEYTCDDKDLFVENFKKYEIDYCVVGVMYWDSTIIKQMKSVVPSKSPFYILLNDSKEQIIDCSSDMSLNTFSSLKTDVFINYLKDNGINVFKKSSCANSNILKVPNVSKYYYEDPDNYCLNCGNCK